MHTEAPDLEAGLRAWAQGSYPDEAAVELLIRSGWARRTAFIHDCTTTTLEDGGGWAPDWDTVERILDGHRDSSVLAASGGELRILQIAHSLARGPLGDTIPGLDRRSLDLVLAAIAHANGSHEHTGPPQPDPHGRWTDQDTGLRLSFPRLGAAYPWPVQEPL